MKQGITPQYWKQENNGRYFTKETQIFSPLLILVDTDQICAALKDAFEDTRAILEPSGALALADLKAWAKREQVQDRTLVAVASDANMNFNRLRFVSERAEIG